MIDSVLKGTGNSRFLKSAVPAGTSWADALAMLQAGTFPVDFNGINTEGFQQIGTPLNKANLLKDATAAQIGLPPSTTPDGMFQALGNTGELHVWRKTVTSGTETTTTYPVSTNPNAYQEGDDAKAAGYVVGEVETGKFIVGGASKSGSDQFSISESINVNDSGEITQNSAQTVSISPSSSSLSSAKSLIGKFIQCTSHNKSDFSPGVIWYIPSDAQITQDSRDAGGITVITYYVNKRQRVTGYPAIPAGTTIEYLGKLGDKARVQVVSYVGTGTTGKNNPCSITMPFKIKTAIMLGYEDSYELVSFLHSEYNMSIIVADQLSTEYKNYRGFLRGTSGTSHSQAYGKISDDNKTIYWYFNSGAYNQCNSSGTKYYVLLLG